MAFLVGLIVAFLFSFSLSDEQPGWGKLLKDIAELTFLSPLLLFFLRESSEFSWISLLPWALKGALVLVIFDIIRKFIPQFTVRHTETVLLKLALPVVCLAFWVLWAVGAHQW